MPKKPPTIAQRASQITFLLKGHLKNARVAYIRAAVMLAKVRDEKLWQALRYRTIVEYAQDQLRLAEPTLYKYLRVHDWLKKRHPSWLAKRPKGFIPELSDVVSLQWIEQRLESEGLEADLRMDLERARKQALAGTLTYSEFVALRARARKTVTPLRALSARTRALRKAASRVAGLPAAVLAGYDAAIRHSTRRLRRPSQLPACAVFRRRCSRGSVTATPRPSSSESRKPSSHMGSRLYAHTVGLVVLAIG